MIAGPYLNLLSFSQFLALMLCFYCVHLAHNDLTPHEIASPSYRHLINLVLHLKLASIVKESEAGTFLGSNIHDPYGKLLSQSR